MKLKRKVLMSMFIVFCLVFNTMNIFAYQVNLNSQVISGVQLTVLKDNLKERVVKTECDGQAYIATYNKINKTLEYTELNSGETQQLSDFKEETYCIKSYDLSSQIEDPVFGFYYKDNGDATCDVGQRFSIFNSSYTSRWDIDKSRASYYVSQLIQLKKDTNIYLGAVVGISTTTAIAAISLPTKAAAIAALGALGIVGTTLTLGVNVWLQGQATNYAYEEI